jgi:hypothetical protein
MVVKMQRFRLFALGVVLLTSSLCAQTSASLSVPEFVKAGEPIEVVVELDHAPNFEGSSILYYITGPEGFSVQSSVGLKTGQSRFSFTYVIPDAAKGGTWSVAELRFSDGINAPIPIRIEPRTFTVIPNKGLIYPQAAQISLNPSQVQLLRGGALRLQLQIQDLREQIKQIPAEGVAALIKGNLDTALAAIGKTKLAYEELEKDPSKKDQINIFFSDISTNYVEAKRSVTEIEKPRIKKAEFYRNSPADQNNNDADPVISQGVFRALEYNQRAYETAASVESLVFDLKITSIPEGAKISYRRRGDVAPTEAPENTNTTLKALTYARWIVRATLPNGYCREKEHDAIDDAYHVIQFDLTVPTTCK